MLLFSMSIKARLVISALAGFSIFVSCSCQTTAAVRKPAPSGEAYETYLDFFEEVYDTMNDNYYQKVDRKAFKRFVQSFRKKIYPQLQETGKSNDYIRWRSAAYLIENLREEDDIFSQFYPPKPAKAYEQEALGKKVDLGIEGHMEDDGYVVDHVEPRSDAYEEGLREGAVITHIDTADIRDKENAEVVELLTPLVDAEVRLTYLQPETRKEASILVVSREYFKQTVFLEPVGLPGIYCLTIERFNRKTAEDMLKFLSYMDQYDPKGLVIDLRGNPGGPPLAAREISAFFLTPGDDFAYFEKKNKPMATLDVPTIPERFRYDLPIVILIDEKSGSASELFSGVLQDRERALLMGENSAGQVFLKSMFHFEDDSMVLLVTARGHYPDGKVFSFEGLDPDIRVEREEEEDLRVLAGKVLLMKYIQANK